MSHHRPVTEWERLPSGAQWRSLPLFNFFIPSEELARHFGEPIAKDLDATGVGLFDVWALRFPCGLEVALWAFHDHLCERVPREAPRRVEVHANDRDGAHILAHFPFDVTNVSESAPVFPPKIWTVMRQDDNGRTFPIVQCTSRCEAELIAREFELRGHKQFYWAARASETDSGRLIEQDAFPRRGG